MGAASIAGVVRHAAATLLVCAACSAPAPRPDAAVRDTLDTLYRAFCFDAGGAADWATMRSLFAEGAVFVDPFEAGARPQGRGVEPFCASFAAWCADDAVRTSGLHERILHARIETAGNIAHAWVGFEGFEPGSGKIRSRGVDSLQLVLDRGCWKVASFTTQYESAGLRLPPRFYADR